MRFCLFQIIHTHGKWHHKRCLRNSFFFFSIKVLRCCEPLNPPSYLASNLQICCAEALGQLESQEVLGAEAFGECLENVFYDSFFIVIADYTIHYMHYYTILLL